MPSLPLATLVGDVLWASLPSVCRHSSLPTLCAKSHFPDRTRGLGTSLRTGLPHGTLNISAKTKWASCHSLKLMGPRRHATSDSDGPMRYGVSLRHPHLTGDHSRSCSDTPTPSSSRQNLPLTEALGPSLLAAYWTIIFYFPKLSISLICLQTFFFLFFM